MSETPQNNNNPPSVPDPQQLEAAMYSYEESDEVPTPETPTTATTIGRNLPNISQYTDAVKELAQQKVFQVHFLDGSHKVYQRRKASMKEVIELERKRAIMKQSKGTPLKVAEALAEFYWYSANVHLVETRSGKPMIKADYENVIFEDFRKIIDACEFVMLFGVPS